MSRRKAGRLTFGWYLTAFALVLALPPIVYSGYLTVRLAADARQVVTDEVHDKAAAVLTASDDLVGATISVLDVLAGARSLREDDLGPFLAEAQNAARRLHAAIVVRDAEGRRLLNTRVPFGSPVPTSGLDESERAILNIVVRTGAPHVSGFHLSPETREPIVAISVPVWGGVEVRRVLTAEIPIDAVHRVLIGIEPEDQATRWASISDAHGTILARSSQNATFSGTKLPGFEELIGRSGTWRGTNLVGVPVFGAYTRSQLSGWTVAVGLPESALEAPFHRSFLKLVGFGILLGVLAGVAALLLSRRIAGTYRTLARLARDLGEGRRVDAPDLPIAEADLVAQALAQAARDLGDRDASLAAARAELEGRVAERTSALAEQTELLTATLENMDQGLLMIDRDGRVVIYNRRVTELLDIPEEVLAAGPTLADLTVFQVENDDFVSEDDAARAFDNLRRVMGPSHVYERRRSNGAVIEVRTVPLAGGGAVRTYTDITARKRAEERIAHMARHDALTALPNRVLLRERLDEHLHARSAAPLALICVDLDRFKTVNDTLGHPAGDALLRGVAERLRGVLREGELVARLGGDEFALVQTQAEQPHGARDLAERLVAAMRAPMSVEGHRIPVGYSLGIAVAPRDGTSADELFKAADLALYRAKADGRGGYRFFEPAMDAAAQERQTLEVELREAIARDELEVHYQPILDLATDRVCGQEALVRWRHPVRGLLSPAMFVPLAEEIGLIDAIGARVLALACHEAARWPAGGRVSVNVSARQLAGDGLFDAVTRALREARLPATRLELEITESALMEDAEGVLRVLGALREIGVSIAMDDFGTGFSSLGYLRRFPFDKIKIDRSFVQDLDNPQTAAIVRAIVGLGARLGMTITAEGVETQEQLALVRIEGCSQAQGYLIGRPAPPSAIFARDASAA